MKKERSQEKGQISIFIIVAIFIVIIIGILVYLRISNNSNSNNVNNINPEIEPIYNHVKDCIESSGIDATSVIGLTGGEIETKLKTNGSVAYYFYDGQSYVPSKEKLESQLDNLIPELIRLCTPNISQFPDFNIKFSNISVDTKINENNVVINSNFPIIISKGNRNYEIKSFKDIVVNNRLGYLHNIATEIIEGIKNNSGKLCINCLYDTSEKYGIYISMHDLDEENSIIILTDPQSKINNENYAFLFAIKLKTIPFDVNKMVNG